MSTGLRAQLVNLVAARGFASLCQALTLVFLGRAAGVSDFGLVATAGGIGLVAFSIADLGLGSYLAKARALRRDADVAAILVVNSATTLGAGLILGLAAGVFSIMEHLSWGIVALFLAFALEKNVDAVLGIAVADGDKLTPGVSIVLRRVLGLVLFVAALALGLDAVASYCLAYLVACAVGQLHIRTYIAKRVDPQSRLVRTGVVPIIRAGFPFLLENFSGQTRTLDTPLITALTGAFTGGLYAAASRITAPLLLIPGALATVMMPHAATRAPAYARRVAVRLIYVSVAILAVALPFIVPFSTAIMAAIFGEEFASAGPAFAWALAGMMFIALQSPLGALLQSQGHEAFVGWVGAIFGVAALLGAGVGALIGGATGASALLAIAFIAKCAVLSARLLSRKL